MRHARHPSLHAHRRRPTARAAVRAIAGAWLGGAILLLGCSSQQSNPASQSPSRSADAVEPIERTVASRQPAPAAAERDHPVTLFQAAPISRDPAPRAQVLVELNLYQMYVPLRAVSKNDDFWRHVDEQVVDVGTHDRLWRNGVRVGLAPRADWDYFAKILSQNPIVSRHTSSTSGGEQLIELAMKQNLEGQYLFYFDRSDEVCGRTFDKCDNLLNVTFCPTPRKLGTVRVTMCPFVRAHRTEIAFSVRNEDREYRFVHPEHFYDLNLRVDIPPEQFMIVAPSPEAVQMLGIGRAMLIHDGAADQYEQVIVISPQPFRFADPPKPTTGPSTNPSTPFQLPRAPGPNRP